MIVNIRLDVDDAHRNVVARKLDGKQVKRLATRSEYTALVADFVSKLGVGSSQVSKRDPEPLEAPKQASESPIQDAPRTPTLPNTDRTPVSLALEAVNNAVFALQIAKRFHPADEAIQKTIESLADARDSAVDAYEKLS